MREFMDYVHSSFYDATGWNRDNSYAALNSTIDGARTHPRNFPARYSAC